MVERSSRVEKKLRQPRKKKVILLCAAKAKGYEK
jgi:hypothetical protein